jgi:hypothetical protein
MAGTATIGRIAAAFDRKEALVWKLVEIEPTTAAGLAALIRYSVDFW